MTTVMILVGLIVVLTAAAAYVGLLLVRRWRSSRSESDPQVPWTVRDLVRMRDGRPELSGPELFTPTIGLPVTDLAAEGSGPVAPGGATPNSPLDRAPSEASPAPRVARPDGPMDGVDVGDAPWRRAARMIGAEPGAAWETAPSPVVPAVRATGSAEPEVRRPAGSSRRDAAPPAPAPTSVEPEPEPAGSAVEPVVELEPAVPLVPEPVVTSESDAVESEPVESEPAPAVEAEPEPAESESEPADPEPEPVAVSRPLSDPELTPLMGIPLVRSGAPTPAVEHAHAAEPAHVATVDVPSGSSRPADPVPAPPPRMSSPRPTDDEVVSLLAVTAPRTVGTGDPQPVWFRVVGRDGDPVADALVTLLDDRGQEVDATKAAADGGGELRTPHGGRFLLIAGADRFQPRAVTLAVDGAPVEVALLLPASATLAGLVSGDGRPVAGARIVARQEGEVVDEIVTGPDGSYRFDDLAEGAYAVTATDRRGTAVLRVDVRESADLRHDLDLVPPGSAP